MKRRHLIEQLKIYGESHPSRNAKVWIGKKIIDMVFYFDAAVSRGFQVQPQKYYVFISGKGDIFECDTPEKAIDTALDNRAFDYNIVEIGDYVDFGIYGQFYVCGQNIDNTKFLVTRDSSQRAKRTSEGFYLEKCFAENIIEKYDY